MTGLRALMSQMKGHARLPGWPRVSGFLVQKSKCHSIKSGLWAVDFAQAAADIQDRVGDASLSMEVLSLL